MLGFELAGVVAARARRGQVAVKTRELSAGKASATMQEPHLGIVDVVDGGNAGVTATTLFRWWKWKTVLSWREELGLGAATEIDLQQKATPP